MSQLILNDAKWYVDPEAQKKDEPGLYNSFVAGLATSLHYRGEKVDPVWLMGASAWAFRMNIASNLCPSATSVFDWNSVLPETVEQSGYNCQQIGRMWHEGHLEKVRRLKAQDAIIKALHQKILPVVWDIGIAEWGVIIGYDSEREEYTAISCLGNEVILPFEQMGNRDIRILSVTIPGERNLRSREDMNQIALKNAVIHAELGEWDDRPKYLNGLAAFELWASILETGAQEDQSFEFGHYYAGTYYGARCYARDFLSAIAGENATLKETAGVYAQVASNLKPVWDAFRKSKSPGGELLRLAAAGIREAGKAEEKGIELIKEYLEK